jgi:hypothetical protein
MPAANRLVGQRFGRLLVTARAENDKHGHTRWSCQCDCGQVHVVAGLSLRKGSTRSCGCLGRETAAANGRAAAPKVAAAKTKHGHAVARTPEYAVWKTMRQRCLNQACEDYHLYGGRGITVCERWSDFAAFFADMGPRPTPKHSIDREDNDGNYEPGNCRWATAKEQANNKRNSRKEKTCPST